MAKFPSRFALLLMAAAFLAGCQTTRQVPPEEVVIGEFLRSAALASQTKHDYTAATSYYQSLYARDPHDVNAAMGLARNLRYAGAAGEAVRVLQRAVQENPGAPELRAEFGKAMLATGNVDGAIKILETAIADSPDNWRAMVGLGIAHDIKGNFEEAQSHYHAALRISPENANILNNLALSKALSGELESGIAILKHAVSLPDAGLQTRQNLALMYATRGDMVQAERLIARDLPTEMVQGNLEYYRQLEPVFAYVNDPAESEPVSYQVAMGFPEPAAEDGAVLVAGTDETAAEDAASDGGEQVAEDSDDAALLAGVAVATDSDVAASPADGQTAGSEPEATELAGPADELGEPAELAEPTLSDTTFAMVAPDEQAEPELEPMFEPEAELEPGPMAMSDSGEPVDLMAEAAPTGDEPQDGQIDLSWLDTLMAPAASGDGQMAPDGEAMSREVQLQLGAFPTQMGAAKWLVDIHESHVELLWGLRFEIAKADVDGGYHLIAGPMDDPALAGELCDQFSRLNTECALIAN